MRIRTIKPEFFTHEELYEAEAKTKLPLRLAYVGLWCVADRDGRFRWQPRRLGVQIMPYDLVDFDAIMEALLAAGFVDRYGEEGEFGVIPSFSRHQCINAREAVSKLPDPAVSPKRTCMHVHARETHVQDCDASRASPSRVKCKTVTREVHARGEGKGREVEHGKEAEEELSSAVPASAVPTPEPAPKKPKSVSEEEKDRRHHEITSRIRGVYETTTGKPFIMDGRFLKRLQVFLSSAPDMTADEFLETYRQAVSVELGQFTPTEIIKAHVPSFFADNFMTVRGLIERTQNTNQNGNHSRPNRPSSRNGEGFSLSEERRAWLNADKLDGPESHRD
jgi:hypothetical protein